MSNLLFRLQNLEVISHGDEVTGNGDPDWSLSAVIGRGGDVTGHRDFVTACVVMGMVRLVTGS